MLDNLRRRNAKSVEETLALVNAFEATYGRFDFSPSHVDDRQDGAYYLERVDALGVRTYKQHVKPKAVRIDKNPNSIVTHIELLQETMDEDMTRGILSAVEPGRIHVFSSACENFCVGGSASGDIDLDKFLEGVRLFAKLVEELESRSDLPIITLCHAATRGGGMLFPAIADICIATEDASFGFPEIRRGVLPGVVSVPSLRRLGSQQCTRWMVTGETFDAQMALRNGFVDTVLPSKDAALARLEEILQQMARTPVEHLQAAERIINIHGDANLSLTTAGRLVLKPVMNEPVNQELVRLRWPKNQVVELEFGDPSENNIMTWELARALTTTFKDLEDLCDAGSLDVVLLRASGDDFCSGGDPMSWIAKATNKDTTEIGEHDTPAAIAALAEVVEACTLALRALPVPVLAVLQVSS